MEQGGWRGSGRDEKATGVRALCDNPVRFLHFPASLTFGTDDNDGTATTRPKKMASTDKQRDPPKPQTPPSTTKIPRPSLDTYCVPNRKPSSAKTRCAASRRRRGVSA